jgi:prepilin-type N-terminal cleavage/methylation domain-containing protein
MNKTTNGFTIIELIVVITVVGILATLGIMSFSNIQKDVRDSSKSAKINIISDYLEKYYQKNGEYPMCDGIMNTTSSEVVTNTLAGMDKSNLSSPSTSSDANSVICTTPTSDGFGYISNGAYYKLRYVKDSNGEVITVKSRRKQPITIAAGDSYSATMSYSGKVWSWGSNSKGKLGDSTLTSRLVPVQTVGPGGSGVLTGVDVIASGDCHSIAIKSDNTVWSWGCNWNGALGNNASDTSESSYSNVPVQVVGAGGSGVLNDIVAISAGWLYTLALKSDGTVWAWGDNGSGVLGNNSPTNSASKVPVQVVGKDGLDFLTGVVAIASADSTSYAVKSDGTVWAWGDNGYGELGLNTVGGESKTPVQVLGPNGIGYLSNFKSIFAGNYSAFAVKSDGAVFAWGDNEQGGLGIGTLTPSYAPTQVLGSGGVGFIGNVVTGSAGDHHTLALKADGTVWAWGLNEAGMLGNNISGGGFFTCPTDPNNCSMTPTQTVGPGGLGFLSGIISVNAGGVHSTAIKSDGTVWAWGWNGTDGRLGVNISAGSGPGSEFDYPVQVLGPSGVGFLNLLTAQ